MILPAVTPGLSVLLEPIHWYRMSEMEKTAEPFVTS